MTNTIEEIVHIVPLGHEYERAIRPFDTVAVNRVYLIVDSGAGAGFEERDSRMQQILYEYYTPRVKTYLEEKHIEVRVVATRTFDLMEFLKTISGIIRDEQSLGNRVLVNMSSSGRLGAVAATLAGMAHNVTVYYVHSERFATDAEREVCGLSICRENHASVLPNFTIDLPDEQMIRVLCELSGIHHQGCRGLSASSLSEILQDEDDCRSPMNTVDSLRKRQSRNLMRVGGLMRRMEERGYVTKKKSGRTMAYTITELGEYALHLSGY